MWCELQNTTKKVGPTLQFTVWIHDAFVLCFSGADSSHSRRFYSICSYKSSDDPTVLYSTLPAKHPTAEGQSTSRWTSCSQRVSDTCQRLVETRTEQSEYRTYCSSVSWRQNTSLSGCVRLLLPPKEGKKSIKYHQGFMMRMCGHMTNFDYNFLLATWGEW